MLNMEPNSTLRLKQIVSPLPKIAVSLLSRSEKINVEVSSSKHKPVIGTQVPKEWFMPLSKQVDLDFNIQRLPKFLGASYHDFYPLLIDQ